jgi:shikimate dehydrogenase
MNHSGKESMAEIPRAAVIGWPVSHSRSPLIHGWWLRHYQLSGRYDRIAVRPEELAGFLEQLLPEGFRGVNITVPHKEAAYLLLREMGAEISEHAHRLRAVNTVWIEDGRIWADNTDSYGFMANFRQHCPDWEAGDKHVVIMGAGGAASAVLAGFQDEGVARITVVNRTFSRAEELTERLSLPQGPQLAAAPLEDLPQVLKQADVLVNATTLGMKGQPPLLIDIAALPPEAIVADIVYVPLKTPLLAQAEKRGLRTVEGLGMLLHQAVPGFERWFGIRPEVTPQLRAHIEADLENE